MKCLFPQYSLFPIVPQLDVSMVINFPKDDSYKEKLVQKFVGHFLNHFDYKLVKGHKLSHKLFLFKNINYIPIIQPIINI
jgi:hypothetical protein